MPIIRKSLIRSNTYERNDINEYREFMLGKYGKCEKGAELFTYKCSALGKTGR